MSILYSPATLGPLTLQNHLVMAPMTRNRAIGNVPNELMAEYYGQRASKGGLIIAEASQVSEDGRGAPCTPGIHTPAQVAGWKLVTDAIHARGGKVFLQLWHMGRLSVPAYQPDGGLPIAPSAVAANVEVTTPDFKRVPAPTPRALETAEIPALIQKYVHAGRCAREAGFDGVVYPSFMSPGGTCVALWRWNGDGLPELEVVDPDHRLPRGPASWL